MFQYIRDLEVKLKHTDELKKDKLGQIQKKILGKVCPLLQLHLVFEFLVHGADKRGRQSRALSFCYLKWQILQVKFRPIYS